MLPPFNRNANTRSRPDSPRRAAANLPPLRAVTALGQDLPWEVRDRPARATAGLPGDRDRPTRPPKCLSGRQTCLSARRICLNGLRFSLSELWKRLVPVRYSTLSDAVFPVWAVDFPDRAADFHV
jgi:hypothetical protein